MYNICITVDCLEIINFAGIIKLHIKYLLCFQFDLDYNYQVTSEHRDILRFLWKKLRSRKFPNSNKKKKKKIGDLNEFRLVKDDILLTVTGCFCLLNLPVLLNSSILHK